MTSKRNPNRNRKRHISERFRSPEMLVERWSNAKCAHIAYHVAMGASSYELSAILADGTSPETLRSTVKKWRLPTGFEKRSYSLVYLSSHKRRLLKEQAAKLGIDPEEMLKRICECAIGDELYSAIVDDRYK